MDVPGRRARRGAAPTRAVGVPGCRTGPGSRPSGRMVAWTCSSAATPTPPVASPPAPASSTPAPARRWHSLEEFAVTRDGRRYRSAGRRTSGASPSPPTTTASTRPCRPAGRRYLVRGDLAARTVETLRDNVECPSLSPDGTRIAFKEAVDADPAKGWRLSVLDLATHARHRDRRDAAASTTRPPGWTTRPLAYTLRRSDGQPDVWSVPADGSGTPALVIPGAESPSTLT